MEFYCLIEMVVLGISMRYIELSNRVLDLWSDLGVCLMEPEVIVDFVGM